MALTQQEATAIARSIVVALCGSRWVSPPVRFIDTYPVTESGRVILSGRPVRQINSVTIGDKTLDPSQYRLYNGFVLDMNIDRTVQVWCARARRVDVDYTYGIDALPTIVQRAVDAFAVEVLAADSGSNACRIPERVTSVTRQGMSWTLLDPQEFLKDGRTGIYEVDLAIKAVNPAGAKRRARVFSITQSAPAQRRPAS